MIVRLEFKNHNFGNFILKQIIKILSSNAFANIFSVLAFIIAGLTFLQSQRQLEIQNQDKLIFTRDSAYSEIVFLLKEDSSYFMNVPIRVILTNRSERNHPLQELIFYVGDNWQVVREIYDKNRENVVLPLNIPANESRVLLFFLKVPLTSNQGQYLLDNLKKAESSSESKWPISSLFELTTVFLGLNDKFISAELIGVHSQGTLVYHFTTTKDGKPFEVKQEYYIP